MTGPILTVRATITLPELAQALTSAIEAGGLEDHINDLTTTRLATEVAMLRALRESLERMGVEVVTP